MSALHKTCVMEVLSLLFCLFVFANSQSESVETLEPSFDVPVVNVTVIAGKTAVLPCSVDYLGEYKVLWMDHRNKLLTLRERRIIFDDRISLERPYLKDWNLHIRNVNHGDSGTYKCQITTNPTKIKSVQLFVQEPAKIIDELSSGDQTVTEGDTVQLVCNTTGIPPPSVNWYRRDINKIGDPIEEVGRSGEILIIHNISRYCADIYECVAFNNIHPPASRQIRVTVEFPPEVTLPTKRIGQSLGKETILECHVTANPQSYSLWKRNGHSLQASWKYRIEVYNEDDNTITISLRIRPIDENDYGDYICMAENKLGIDTERMILYEYTVVKSTTTTTTTESPRIVTDRPQTGLKPGTGDLVDKTTNYFTNRPIPDGEGPEYFGPGESGERMYKDNSGSICVSQTTFWIISVLTLICKAIGR